MKKRQQQSHRLKPLYTMLSLAIVGLVTLGSHALITGSGKIAFHSSGYSVVVDEEQSYIGSLLVASFDVPFKDHLSRIKIEPNLPGGISIVPNETIRLTSVGIFTTWEQQIQSNWFLLRHGFSKQAISDCQGRSTCSYTAGNIVENIDIQAESAGKKDSVTLKITDTNSKKFSDAVPDWAAASINNLNQIGIINGYADGRYGAGDTLTQGQVITLLYRTLLHSNRASEPTACREFSSLVPQGHYAYLPLCLFHTKGWDTDWNFDPNASISRAEAAAYIYVVFGEDLLSSMGIMQGAIYVDGQIFTDVPTTHTRFYEISVANKTAIMTGNPDRTFSPDRILNRAEAAIVMHRLLQQL